MKRFLILLTLSINYCFAQNTIGLPEIVNFPSQDYHGGTQTWCINQGKNGILYFANNDGLLSFDGNYWKQYVLPNKTIVRSIAIDSLTGYIFVGSQNEMGFFSPGPNGELVYTSLKELIPKTLNDFSEIWHIEIIGAAVFFRANKKIFEYKDHTIRVFKAPSEWRYMKAINGKLFAQDRNEGILQFKDNSWQSYCNHPVLKEGLITGLMEYNQDTVLVTTLRNGIFLLHNGMLIPKKTVVDEVFYSDRIYCATKVNKDEFAIGTTSGGCYVINAAGKLIQSISRVEGLQNNNILTIFLDNTNNLWMGLDNGIDFVAYNSPVKRILPDKINQLSGYAIKIINDRLYIGTSDGLYTVPLQSAEGDLSFSKGNFVKVPNTNGQVWRIDEINKQVLMEHHDGTFIITDNQVRQLLSGVGSWFLMPLSTGINNREIIAGTYNGLQLLQTAGNNFTDNGKIDGLVESLRFLTVDDENIIWASHPNKGVYKIQLSGNHKSLSYKLYTQASGLPANLNNFVYNIKGRVVIATQKGIYEYNLASDKFIRSRFFNVFDDKSVTYLNEDADGNIWFNSDKKIGVVDYNQPSGAEKFSVVYFPELTNKLVKGFEYIYPYNLDNIFIGSEKGVYHLNYRSYLQHAYDLKIYIGTVKIIGDADSLIFGGYMPDSVKADKDRKIAELKNSWHSVHFEYSSPVFEQQRNIEYSYQLIGFDDKWSAWTKKTEKDYTNLHSGTYTFMVKARTNAANESKPVSYSFKIKPGWFQTWFAYLCYLLLLYILTYLFIKWQRKKFVAQQNKHQQEQEHLRYMYQLEKDRNEKEIIKLQNEKLESDVNFKNKELANATMHLVERGKVLSRIREELIRFEKNSPTLTQSNDFKRIINLLNDAEKNDSHWDQFVSHFDQVYGNFLTHLKAKYKTLTSTDLKLSAYLRMNLSSKEISQLMNISVRGVEIARYRLRKKLQIQTDENLNDFLINMRTGD